MPTKDPQKKREKEQRKYLKRKTNNPDYLKRKNLNKEKKRKKDPNYQKNKNAKKTVKLKNNPALRAEKQERRNSRKKDFLAFDGEGGDGKYVLLANSIDYIYNPEGLSTSDCLKFLIKRYNVRWKIFFFFSYDINLILKDLSEEDKLKIFRGIDVTYQDYSLSYIPRKIFKIRYKGKTHTYYDTGSFYQTSLVNACKKNNITIPDIIISGKNARGINLMEWSKEDIIEYNLQECLILEQLLDKLKEALSLEVLGKSLLPSQWYGPGAVANILLNQIRMRRYTKAEKLLPEEISNILPYAFYGGRIEALKLGNFDCKIHSYDIRSAYPYTFSNLPEISLSWYETTKPDIETIKNNPFSIFLVSWNIQGKEWLKLPAPFPYRDKNGFIYYPGKGKGYYYGIELINALDIYPQEFLSIEKGFIMFDRGSRPFKNQIQSLYKLRQELKAKGDGRELALKLSFNSMYGKTIQSTGSKRYQSLYYAGLITAQCRAQLLSAVKNVLSEVISFQTDGIKTLKPLNDIVLDTELGNWEYDTYDRFQILGAGIYRGFKGNEPKIITARGYNLRYFDFEEVCQNVKNKGYSDIKTSLFIGNLLAIMQKNAYGSKINDFALTSRAYNPMKWDIRQEGKVKRRFDFMGYPDFEKEKYDSKLDFTDYDMSYPYGVFTSDILEELEQKAFNDADNVY